MLFINNSGKVEAIIFVKIVGLKVMLQFKIEVKLCTKTTFNGYMQSLKFCVAWKKHGPSRQTFIKNPGL